MLNILMMQPAHPDFMVHEIDELASLVCPTIHDNTCSTGVERVILIGLCS